MSVSANNKKVYLRCPLCGRQPVATKRGRIVSHLSPGGVKCSAIGMEVKAWMQARAVA